MAANTRLLPISLSDVTPRPTRLPPQTSVSSSTPWQQVLSRLLGSHARLRALSDELQRSAWARKQEQRQTLSMTSRGSSKMTSADTHQEPPTLQLQTEGDAR